MVICIWCIGITYLKFQEKENVLKGIENLEKAISMKKQLLNG